MWEVYTSSDYVNVRIVCRDHRTWIDAVGARSQNGFMVRDISFLMNSYVLNVLTDVLNVLVARETLKSLPLKMWHETGAGMVVL